MPGVVCVKYRKSMEQVSANVRYIGFRSREREDEEKGFFNRALDNGADYKSFLDKIENHEALQHSSTVKSHSIILSLKEDEYRKLLKAGGNLKDCAREVMDSLEFYKGMKLEWVAALHENSGHPHVHISVMSVGKDEQGNTKRLRLDKDDFTFLRSAMNSYVFDYVPPPVRGRTKKHPLDKLVKGVAKDVMKIVGSEMGLEEKQRAPQRQQQPRRNQRRAKGRVEMQKQEPETQASKGMER